MSDVIHLLVVKPSHPTEQNSCGGRVSQASSEGLQLGVWRMDGFRQGHAEGGNGPDCCYFKAAVLMQLSAKEVPECVVSK